MVVSINKSANLGIRSGHATALFIVWKRCRSSARPGFASRGCADQHVSRSGLCRFDAYMQTVRLYMCESFKTSNELI